MMTSKMTSVLFWLLPSIFGLPDGGGGGGDGGGGVEGGGGGEAC